MPDPLGGESSRPPARLDEGREPERMATDTERHEADDLYNEGVAAALAGKRATAERLLRASLALNPDRHQGWLWLAGVVKDPHESVQYLQCVLELHPGDPHALEGLEWARQRLGLSPEAAAELAGTGPTRPAVKRTTSRLRKFLGFTFSVTIMLSMLAISGDLAVPLALADAMAHRGMLPAVTDAPAAVLLSEGLESVVIELDPAKPIESPAAAVPGVIMWNARAFRPPWFPAAHPLTALSVPGWYLRPAPGQDIRPVPGKWIEVDLSDQVLRAFQDGTTFMEVKVSTGLKGTPTVKGTYNIKSKYKAIDMTGPGYSLPKVPYTMFFYEGYSLHGTYWHKKFGQPMSHGCVNMRTEDAKKLFNWAEPKLSKGSASAKAGSAKKGTLVIVHD